ncbi:GNAT family N-acetyltransferase [Hydrotalea sp.]|uniref:GNAT family N-acetyltransferase n=1 Tax=Hydrotalea sp. TaxID=2881279 RepID=UPI00260CDDAD|nr:GNAT family N-acetyltransferase [Hydrotalea sp.]
MNEEFSGIAATDIIILKVLLSELQQLAVLCRNTFYDTYHACNSASDMQLYLNTKLNDATIVEEWQNPDNDFFIAWLDNNPIGYCKLARHTQPDNLHFNAALEIARLYVINGYKNTGLGRQFIQLAKNVAKEHSCNRLWLIVWKQNKPAIAFYEKQGFTIAGEQQFILGKDVQFDWVMQMENI